MLFFLSLNAVRPKAAAITKIKSEHTAIGPINTTIDINGDPLMVFCLVEIDS